MGLVTRVSWRSVPICITNWVSTVGEPGFEESQWITSEDVNAEHLLDVFTSIEADSEHVWAVCMGFMEHLCWHKPRHVVLGSKVEALPDSHRFKLYCLLSLSRLFDGVGNWTEKRRVLIQSLGISRERGDNYWIATTLMGLADVDRQMDLLEEGIARGAEALKTFVLSGDTGQQGRCLLTLASLLHSAEEFDAAEEAASRAMELLRNQDQHYLNQSHKILGEIYQSKGNTKEAIHHLEESLRISSSLNSLANLSKTHISLADLYFGENKFNDAHLHIEHAKSLAGNNMLLLGCTFGTSARGLLYINRPEEAKSEASRALAIFEELGATGYVEVTKRLLENIEEKL